MKTRDMSSWETGIAQIVSDGEVEDVVVRGRCLDELVGRIGFAEMMFLVLQGRLPSRGQARVLDGLLVASVEHGIAPPSMVSRCFASYGTSLQAAVAGGILAFGDRMGGLGEQLARMMFEALGSAELENDVGEGIRGGPGGDGDAVLVSIAARIVGEAARSGGRVPGFGIPLHGADPRAPRVLDLARREGIFGPYCRLAVAIESALADSRAGRAVPMNLDGVGAAVALDLGFPWQATRLFLLTPRTVSMGAHYLEEAAQDTAWRHVPASQVRYDGEPLK